MGESTSRFGFPLLVAGQAQKEVTHNEALLLVDALLHANVRSRARDEAVTPGPGDSWIVPDGAGGDWRGKAGALATWTEGGLAVCRHA